MLLESILEPLSSLALAVVFAAAALVVSVAGTRLARVAGRLSRETGLGEALTGGIILGGATSLPGIVTSVYAAAQNLPGMAVSNAAGGIAAQTFFIAVADLVYRRRNLEHAAASVETMLQGALLATLLALPLLAVHGPDVSVLGLHPATLLVLGGYVAGIRMIQGVRGDPGWRPVGGTVTTPEADGGFDGQGWTTTALGFAGLAVVVGVAGYAIAAAGVVFVARGNLSESVAGTFFTAVATSLPELVTTLAAVRQGALALAVSGIVGGNAFDMLLVALSDVAYRSGSIYHHIGGDQLFILVLALAMTGVLLMGLIRRQRHGPANIGFEGVAIAGLYLVGVAVIGWG